VDALSPGSAGSLRRRQEFDSASPGNEARDAGFDDLVEPLPDLNAIDFVQGILREGGDIEILARAGCGRGSGEQCRAALNGPSQQDLRRRLSYSCGDRQNDRILEGTGVYAVAQRGEGQKYDAVFPAKFQEPGFRQIGVGLDLNDGGLDAGGLVERLEFGEGDVGEADGAATAASDEGFEGSPGVQKGDFVVVDDIAVLIARVLLVAGLKGVRSVNEVEIEIAEPETFETRIEGRLDALGTMIEVPQFCSDENVRTGEGIGGEARLQRVADFALVAVALGAIEVAKAGVERVANGSFGENGIGDESAKAERGDAAGTVVERERNGAEGGRVGHGYSMRHLVLGRGAGIQKLRTESYDEAFSPRAAMGKNNGMPPEKYARIERERRFLLARFPDRAAVVRKRRIADHYIEGTTLRLRQQSYDDGLTTFKLTQKLGARGGSWQQGFITSLKLTRDEYLVLAQLPAKKLTKTRFSVPPFGLDVFEGELDGLILAEAEFESAEAADAFAAPSFAAGEVSADDRFTGGRLVRASRQEMRRWLLEYGVELPAAASPMRTAEDAESAPDNVNLP